MNDCPTLPATGGSTVLLVTVAATLIAAGALLAVVTARRHRTSALLLLVVAVGAAGVAMSGSQPAAATSACPPTTTTAPEPTTTAPQPTTTTTTTTTAPGPTTSTTSTTTTTTSTTTTTTSTTTTTTLPTIAIAADDNFTFASADGFQGDVLANDTPGQTSVPFEVATFGGGDLGGASNEFPPGTSAPLGSGTVQLDADGTLTVSPGIAPAVYTFSYILQGGSMATVTLTITEPTTTTTTLPLLAIAVDDSFSFASADGLQDNVLANDTPGQALPFVVGSFGGGDLGGDVFDIPPGASAPLGAGTVQIDADGTITVSPGIAPGAYTFQYSVPVGDPDVATVTLTIT